MLVPEVIWHVQIQANFSEFLRKSAGTSESLAFCLETSMSAECLRSSQRTDQFPSGVSGGDKDARIKPPRLLIANYYHNGK